MITVVKPINVGRMGNYLFQVAAAIAYADKHGLEFTVPTHTKDPKWNPIYLQHLANKRWDPNAESVTIEEKTHAYHEIAWDETWRGRKNVILDGYWQTEKYFKHIREKILSLLGYPWNPQPGVVSVHVRRGDYLRLQHKHPYVPPSWLLQAMSLFPGHQFRFFSDEIDWCQGYFGHRKDCTFSKGQCEEKDLIDMSGCEHHICSASTFSWWGAWLNRNPNKRIVIPAHWFGPRHGDLDTSDIVPPEWQRLPV